MRRFFFAVILIVAYAAVAACAQNANGVRFDQIPRNQLKQDQANIYFFRDKVFYVVQAPYIVTANVTMDGQQIGGLKNGGFILTTVLAGKHYFTVWSGTDRTDWFSNVPAGSNIYFQVWDKTRMEGARAVNDALAGAWVGGIEGATQGAEIGFRGRVREGEGRIWAVDLVGEGDALPRLENLSVSDKE